jgi:high-affinity Fe2+/Pb2+ permease
LRWPVVAVLAIAFGVMATVVTGEAAIGWAFVLIDIAMVVVAASVGLLLAHRLERARWKARRGGP